MAFDPLKLGMPVQQVDSHMQIGRRLPSKGEPQAPVDENATPVRLTKEASIIAQLKETVDAKPRPDVIAETKTELSSRKLGNYLEAAIKGVMNEI